MITKDKSKCSFRKTWFVLFALFLPILVNAQPWTYDFGTGTGSHTSTTFSTSFLPTPSAAGGTARVRCGTNPGSFTLANSGLAGLGTGSELQFTSNTGSTSTSKFSVYGYTASKVGYFKSSIVLNGGTNGVYILSIGSGANFSDNNPIGTAQIFAGIQWSLGASNAITYKVLNSATFGTTGITNSTTLFTQSTSSVCNIEVYYNNSATSASYTRSGLSYTLANATWDLWVNNNREGTNLAKGGFNANTNIDSYAFNHQVNASAPGTLYIDDIEYSNALPSVTPTIVLSSANPAVPDANLAQSTTKNPIYKFSTAVTVADATLNSVAITTTNAAADVTKYQLWYNSTDDFSTASQIGLDITTSLGSGSHSFAGLSQTITSGSSGYFWITADISATATPANTIVSSISNADIIFAAGTKSGTVYIGGTQTIVAASSPLLGVTALTDFGSQCINATYGPNSFTLTGSNLTAADVTVGALSGFTYSTTTGGSYTSTLTITPTLGSINQVIYVKFSPTATLAYDGNIAISGGGAGSINRSVTGSGIYTPPVVTSSAATPIVNTTATLNGSATTLGVCPATTEKGFVYSVSSTNADPIVGGAGVTKTSVAGLSTGTFTLPLTGLTPSTGYSFKSYLYDGSTYTYGAVTTFTTLAPATKLVFSVSPPATGYVSTSLTSFTVQAQRADNSVDAEYTGNIVIAKTTGSGAISGTLTVAAVAGVASFSTVKFDATDTYTITASSGSLTTVTSGNIVINLAPTVLLAWQFGTPESIGSEITYTATTINSNLNSSSLTRGSGITATGLARGFSANAWENLATKATAVSTNEYFQYTVKANTGYKVSLSTLDATLRRTSTAPNAYIWKYSIDGTNFYEIGTDVSFTSTADGVAQTQIDLSGIPALQNVASGTTITFRIYAWGGTSLTSTFAFARYATANTTNCLALGGNMSVDIVAPSITSTAVSSVGATSATFNGNITSNNGSSITDRGFSYKATTGVVLADNQTSEGGTAIGTFGKSFSSLSVNTQYFYKAYATNLIGTTLSSNEINFYTLANVPSAPTVNNATVSSLDVTVNVNSNPANTEFAIKETGGLYVQANGTLGVPAVWQTAAVWNTIPVIGLTSSTSYGFQVKARNGDLVETAFSGSTTLSTLANLSPELTLGAITVFGNQCLNTSSAPNSFVITGINLTTAAVTLGGLTGFTYSTTVAGTYTTTLSLTQPGGSYSQTIYVKFTPTAIQSYNGDIVVGGGGATSVNRSVTGAGINTLSTVTTTSPATAIASTTVTASGNVTDAGCQVVTARGICYGVAINPNITGTKTTVAGTTGAFSSNITSLLPNTLYHFRAYSTTSAGTSYGSDVTFTTSNITVPVAIAATNVLSDGFTANWNALAGAGSYRLDVCPNNLFSVSKISENFSGFVTNNGSVDRYTALDTYLQTTGWAGTAIYEMIGYAKMGTASAKGRITSPTLDLSTNSGNSILTFDLMKWPSDATIIQIYHAPDGVNFALVGGEITAPATMTTQTVLISGGTVNSKIRITAKYVASNRFYLDNISVQQSMNLPEYDNLTVNGTSQIVTGLTASTTYYYRVRAVSGSNTSANSNIISVTTSAITPSTTTVYTGTGNWSVAGNWNNGIPTATMQAIIAGHCTLTSAGVCNNLTINPAYDLTVDAGQTLTINGQFTIKSSAAGTGSYLNNGTVTYAQTPKVERYISQGAWHYITSPIQNAVSGTWQNVYLKDYNEATNGFNPLITPLNIPMTVGKGFALWSSASTTGNVTRTYTGTLNEGDHTLPLQYSGGAFGYNLIGNVFTSAITPDINNWTRNSVDPSLWVWNASTGNYQTWNASLGTGTLTGTTIPASQGFLVHATAAGASVTIMQSKRVHSADPYHKDVVNNNLLIRVAGNNYADGLVVNFYNDATNDYDKNYDVEKINGLPNAPQIATLWSGKKLSINVVPEITNYTVMPMSFYCTASGTYNVTAEGISTFTSTLPIRLKDMLTNQIVDLRQQTSYQFTHEYDSTSTAPRFNLIFGMDPTGISENVGEISVYANESKIIVSNPMLINLAQIAIYNNLGQLVKMLNSPSTLNKMEIDVTFAVGTYIVKTIDTKGNSVVKKVIIR